METSAVRHAVEALRARPTAEVLVIGGGVNGLAVLRELALQGVDAVLVEAEDFASGASGASSHMIHGGIRYLENGEFRLVRESVQERNSLLRTAPHLVKPLRTVVPISTFWSGLLAAPWRMLTHVQRRPRERGALLIKVGLMIYDTFSRGNGLLPRHRFAGRQRTRAEFPAFHRRIRYSARYFDASVPDPERMCLDLLHDAVGAGARAANHLRAIGFRDGRVLLRDEVSGVEFGVVAPVVLNASGPWVDLTNAALGAPSRHMGGTKGSHIVLDDPALLEATRGSEIFFENSDGRVVLIYPLKGRVMIGTTDIDADPSEPAVCTEQEVDYFIDLVALVFPDLPVRRERIVYRFSGIRPLPRHDDLEPGFVSRDYRVVTEELDDVTVLSLVGGKLTTFRALAETLGADILRRLGRPRTVDMRDRAIGGGLGYPRDHAARAAWARDNAPAHPAARVETLLERYGTRCAELLRSVPRETPLSTLPDYSAEELTWLALGEQVVHLGDLVQRRTSLALEGRLTTAALVEIAEVAGAALGWTDARRTAEIDRLVSVLRERHGVVDPVGA
ncbi:MAG TPA: glycerol-3-phosphate dehydrogenase/oxidase [Protaetiibacter sp.]|nr:glycerol-3-phosphate dehydrogenase/oxidase [Protaetiibacter sp.]